MKGGCRVGTKEVQRDGKTLEIYHMRNILRNGDYSDDS